MIGQEAMPTPPPTTTQVLFSGTSLGRPSGPATSRIASPGPSSARRCVVAPTAMKITRTRSPSTAEIVSGIRSPSGSTRTIRNCPARACRATCGASTTSACTRSASGSASTTLYTQTASEPRWFFCTYSRSRFITLRLLTATPRVDRRISPADMAARPVA